MAIDFNLMAKSHHEQGIQRPRLPVDDCGGYTGSQTLYMSYPMREIVLANDSSSANLTFTITGPSSYSITFTLLPGDVFDERLAPFTQVAVTATGDWRYVVRSGVVS